MRKSFAALLGGVLMVELIVLPLPTAWAEDPPPEENTPVEAGFTEQQPASKAPKDEAAKFEPGQVGDEGEFRYSIAIKVPPGRKGMTPSVALAYSSQRGNEASAYGVGWSLPVSSIARSRRFGTPRIEKDGRGSRYSDGAPSGGIVFERDGVELVAIANEAGGSVHRDRVDHTNVKSVYFTGDASYWVVTDPSGTQHFYGSVPSNGSVARTVVEDDLGVTQWMLVRSVDPFGNAIDYSYVQVPRASLSEPQHEPLLERVDYGANAKAGHAHHAQVSLVYRDVGRIRLDHARGHLVLDRVLDHVDVRALGQLVRTYQATIERADHTSRYVLGSLQEVAGDLRAPAMQFHYSDSKVRFTETAALAAFPRFIYRLFWQAGKGPSRVPWDLLFRTQDRDCECPDCPEDDLRRWACLSLWPTQFLLDWDSFLHFYSAPGVGHAFQFKDLDGDGAPDFLYHPNFVAGAGHAQPWASYLHKGLGPDGKLQLERLFTEGGRDPLSTSTWTSEYVDVDRDGYVDRVLVAPQPNGSTRFGQSVNFHWQDPECARLMFGYGVIDPLQLWPLGPNLGIDSPIGGHPEKTLSDCFDRQPFILTIGSPEPKVEIEHGRLGNPQAPIVFAESVLEDYPHWVEIPQYEPKLETRRDPVSGKMVPQLSGIQAAWDVFMPTVDLDGDGKPEMVLVKSKQPKFQSLGGTQLGDTVTEHFGAGVWRIQELRAVTEAKDASTQTRFVETLQSILMTERSILDFGSLLRNLTLRPNYQCPTKLVGPAAEADALVDELAAVAEETDASSLDCPKGDPKCHPLRLDSPLLGRYLQAIGQIALKRLTAVFKNPILHTDLVEKLRAIEVPTQRLIDEFDWVTQFLDLNGDGLADFLMAKGAECYDSLGPRHTPGFDVFLNRGDRFETSSAVAFADGPFGMVRNWLAGNPFVARMFGDANRFPFSALSFSDVNSDGIVDAVLSAGVTVDHVYADHPNRWLLDSNACVQSQVTEDIQELEFFNVRCAWRGTGTGWIAAPELAEEVQAPFAIMHWLPYEGPKGTFSRRDRSDQKPFESDLARFADMDLDGMPDLVRAVWSDSFGHWPTKPEEDATRVRRNRASKPDLLEAVDNGTGGTIAVAYEPARRDEMIRVPNIPWVVRTVVRSPQAAADDGVVAQSVRYAYSGGKYDFSRREFLGFRNVTETQTIVAADGATEGGRVVDREYFQDDDATENAPNPKKGLVRSEIVRSDPEGAVETTRTFNSYELVPRGSYTSVRQTHKASAICRGAGCLSAAGARITNTTSYSDFDEFDHPKIETTVAARTSIGDGFDGSITIIQKRAYQNDANAWILGLVTSFDRSDGATTLGHEEYDYYATGELKQKRVTRTGANPECTRGAATFNTDYKVNDDGMVSNVTTNNNLIAGGATPERAYIYDTATHTEPATVTDFYRKNNQPASLTTSYLYDTRFGTVRTTTDPNGRTFTTERDALGRVVAEYGPTDVLLRSVAYDWDHTPISSTETQVPGFSQPNIVRTRWFDGFGRERQVAVATSGGAIVESWRTFDSLGNVSESALPFRGNGFVARAGGLTHSITRNQNDVLGRAIESRLPDGRMTSTIYAVGLVEDIDARGTPRRHYADALGRVVAVEERFGAEGTPVASLGSQWTTFARNADGDILAVIDADGNQRAFAYNERHQIVRTTAPFRTTEPAPYRFCFDGEGRSHSTILPSGIIRADERDELGRVLSRKHSRPFERDDVTYTYDESAASNSLGRLSSVTSATGRWHVSYDDFGNARERSFAMTLGRDASPWVDATFAATTDHDRLGRPVAETLPYSPVYFHDAISLVLSYDERGLVRSLSMEGAPLLEISRYSAAARPEIALFANGTSQAWQYDPVNDRLMTSQVRRGLQVHASYAFTYDANDNPTHIDRLFGPATTISKDFHYDTLNRLESATIDGTAYRYAYSPAGNILEKDGFQYRYEGADPQAVTSRTKGSSTEQYSYDTDGQMLSAAHDEHWSYDWDGEGRLAGANDFLFRYDAEGNRVLKRTRLFGDLYVGPLELRGSEYDSPSALHAFHNVDLGALHMQLALRRDVDGRLARDAAADRYYHTDYLGSTVLVTSPDGLIANPNGDAGRIDYDPYGTPIIMDVPGTNRIKQRFNGKELDETGLSYYGARYADLRLGRWLSRDSVPLLNPEIAIGSSQGAQLYSFADNNPATRVDGNGKFTAETAETLIRLAPIVGPIITPIALEVVAVGAAVAVAFDVARGSEADMGSRAAKAMQSLMSGDKPAVQQRQPQQANASQPAEPGGPGDKGPEKQPAKEPPNPGGSKGGPEHRETIEKRIEQLKSEGHEHIGGGSKPEEVIRTPGGEKSFRRPDITTRDPQGKIYRENVGRETKAGKPIARERRALDDLEKATGTRPKFTPYKKQ